MILAADVTLADELDLVVVKISSPVLRRCLTSMVFAEDPHAGRVRG